MDFVQRANPGETHERLQKMNTDKEAKPIIQQPAQGTSTNGTGDQSAAQPLQESTKKELIDALRQNWQREVEGMRTYRDLARRERDTARHNVLLKLVLAGPGRGRCASPLP